MRYSYFRSITYDVTPNVDRQSFSVPSNAFGNLDSAVGATVSFTNVFGKTANLSEPIALP